MVNFDQLSEPRATRAVIFRGDQGRQPGGVTIMGGPPLRRNWEFCQFKAATEKSTKSTWRERRQGAMDSSTDSPRQKAESRAEIPLEQPPSLIRGGPVYRLQEATHLIRPNQWNLGRRITLVIRLGWLPLVILTATATVNARLSTLALLKDYRVNARVFIAIPLLIAGQVLMEIRFRQVAQHLLDAGLLKSGDLPLFNRILLSVRKLRDSRVAEL